MSLTVAIAACASWISIRTLGSQMRWRTPSGPSSTVPLPPSTNTGSMSRLPPVGRCTSPILPQCGSDLKLLHQQVAVGGAERCHLAESDPAAAQHFVRRIMPFKEPQPVDGKLHLCPFFHYFELVEAGGVFRGRQRVRALGHQFEAGALAEVAGAEGALGLVFVPEVG